MSPEPQDLTAVYALMAFLAGIIVGGAMRASISAKGGGDQD